MTKALNALALALLLMAVHAGTPGCLRVDHGIVVELEGGALPGGAASRVTLEDGTSFVVDAGEVTLLDIALLRCASTSTSRVEAWPAFPGSAFPGPPTARAHDHGGAQLTLAGPFQISLVDAPVVLGVLTPPPGTYCALHVRLGTNLEAGAARTISMRGHTLAQELRAESTETGSAHLVLPEPLALDRSGAHTLRMSLFEAEPFAAMSTLVDGESALGAAMLRGVSLQGAVAVAPRATPSRP